MKKLRFLLLPMLLIFLFLASCDFLKNATVSESVELNEPKEITSIYLKDDVDFSLNTNNLDNDLTKIKINVRYSDGTTEVISLNKSMISEDDYNKLKNGGTYDVTVNYKGINRPLTLSSKIIDFELSYSTLITSDSTATVTINYVDGITEYELVVKDEFDNTTTINLPETKKDFTELNPNYNYTISGYYKYVIDDVEYKKDFTPSGFTTFMYSKIAEANQAYKVDENTVSATSISVDLSPYVSAAPFDYYLGGVVLVDKDENLVGEIEYKGDSIVYFEDLTPNTEYQTYFYYNRREEYILTDFQALNGNTYRYFFKGFLIYTVNDDNYCMVKIVYDENPDDDEICELYRYQVRKGGDVPYWTNTYVDPFSFRMPIKYENYRAIGNYPDLQNVTENKTVYVTLFPRYSDVGNDEHIIIFMDDDTHAIIDRQVIPDGEDAVEPEGIDKTVESEQKFVWKNKLEWKVEELNNVTHSMILIPSSAPADDSLPKKPSLKYASDRDYIGTDFYLCALDVNDYGNIIKEGPTRKLTDLTTNEEITGEPVRQSYYDYYYFKDLKPNHEYRISLTYKYDYPYEFDRTITEEHTVTISYVIHTLEDKDYTYNEIESIESRYFANIDLKLKNPLDYKDNLIIYMEEEKAKVGIYDFNATSSFEKDTNLVTFKYFKTNTEYRFYSVKYEEEDIDVDNTSKKISHIYIPRNYTTQKTKDGLNPTKIVLNIYGYKSGSGRYYPYNDFTNAFFLTIGGYEIQEDIGEITYMFNYVTDNSNDYEYTYISPIQMTFHFDSEKGKYVPKSVPYELQMVMNGVNPYAMGKAHLTYVDMHFFYNVDINEFIEMYNYNDKDLDKKYYVKFVNSTNYGYSN